MKQSNIFYGFTPDTFQFLKDLGENNYKPWFDEHKPIYELELLQPLKALVVAMTPAMYELDKQIDFRPNKTISRIYRDIRFSHDKTPYKTHMWMTFQRLVSQWENFPAFFMEISTEGYRYGMGLYDSKKKIMDDFRSHMEYDPEHFREITEPLITKHGFKLEGEQYVRPLKNNLQEYFQTWIQRKYVYLIKTCPIGNELFNPEFAQLLAGEFALMKPFYDYLVDICE